MRTIVYDLETYSNCFLAGFKLPDGSRATFEISDRKNQLPELVQTLMWIKNEGHIMVGFNNLGFDYHIIHKLLMNPQTFTYKLASEMASEIINRQDGNRLYPINYTDRIIHQLDLFLLNHFDNAAKRTSLKKLEAAMRMDSIEDLPFDLRPLTHAEKDILIQYMHHDIDATELFLNKCKEQIDLRLDLKAQGLVHGDVLNMSDVKLGEQYFVTRLGRDEFYIDGKKKQSVVNILPLKDVILPYINYVNPAFNIMFNQFKNTIWQDGVEFTWPSVTINGVEYAYGRGGIHASKKGLFVANDEYAILDLDVTSMYPSIAIVNGIKPQHLSNKFTEEYAALKAERVRHDKKSAMNKVLKLALNGVFGNSGNKYSIFYDNKYLMSTTINGQLLISMLIDRLLLIEGLEIIQANTDGVTVRVRRDKLVDVEMTKRMWESVTKLNLEEVSYKRMWVRDVNNYLSEYENGKVKAKGEYYFPESIKDYDGNWNKNYSLMIVAKLTRKILLEGTNVYDEVFNAATSGNIFDFTALHSNSSGGYLTIGGVKCGKNTRFLVTHNGSEGVIVYPPKGDEGTYKRKNGITDEMYNSVLTEVGNVWDARIHTANKSKYTERKVSLVAGKKVTPCNNIKDVNISDIDFNWYAEQILKLTEVFNEQRS